MRPNLFILTLAWTAASAEPNLRHRELIPDDVPSCFDVVLRREDRLSTGEVIYNDNQNMFITQTPFGYLQLRLGTVEEPGDVLWQSFFNPLSPSFGTSFRTIMQGDGHLWTRSNDLGQSVWSSLRTSDGSKKYFFGLECSRQFVQIISETGDVLYSREILDPASTPSPTPAVNIPPIPDTCFTPLLDSSDYRQWSSRSHGGIERFGNIFVHPTRFGPVEIYYRESNSKFKLIWNSTTNRPVDGSTYTTVMQNDGNLVTRNFRNGNVFWASTTSVSTPLGLVVAGLTCDLKRFQIRSPSQNYLLYDEPTLVDEPASIPPDDCFVTFMESNYNGIQFRFADVRAEYAKVDGGVFMRMGTRGALEIRRGFFDNPGELLWTPDAFRRSNTDYEIILQGDSNLIIQDEDDRSYISWNSGTVLPIGVFEFGIRCDLQAVEIRSVPDKRVVFSRPTTIAEAEAPTPAPIPSGCFLGFLDSDSKISPGQIIERSEGNFQATLELTDRGAIEVRRGTSDARGSRVWISDPNAVEDTSNIQLFLQHDSHLLVQRVGSDEFLWRSGSVEPYDDYIFGVTCDFAAVQIRSINSGRIVFDRPALNAPAPCRTVLMTSEDPPIYSRQTRNSIDGTVYIRMTVRGALEIRSRNRPGASLLWQSSPGTFSSSSRFEANLQGDGHLLIRNEDSRDLVYRSNTVANDDNWHFGVTCDLSRVQIWSESGTIVLFDKATIGV